MPVKAACIWHLSLATTALTSNGEGVEENTPWRNHLAQGFKATVVNLEFATGADPASPWDYQCLHEDRKWPLCWRNMPDLAAQNHLYEEYVEKNKSLIVP